MFDSLSDEYKNGNIKNKKKNRKICSKYLKNAINNFLYNEFNNLFQTNRGTIKLIKFGRSYYIKIITDLQW